MDTPVIGHSLMPGTVTLTRRNEVSIHTYTSPEAGWLVNTHIIELPTQLLVVDAQYTLTFASEVVRYAETLRNRSLVFISHIIIRIIFSEPPLSLLHSMRWLKLSQKSMQSEIE